jgi:RNA polymerase sigma-70 factor (ECF subfamily)
MPAASRHPDLDTDALLERTSWGDEDARAELLRRHRARLRQMIAVRMDARLKVRVDPSDLAQEVLNEANQRIDDFVRDRPVPFHVWLREIAWKRLVDLKRKHVGTARRSLLREVPQGFDLPEESSVALADRLVARGPSPSAAAQLNERRAQVRVALESLPPIDREVLVLRYLEQLSPAEIGEILGMTKGAVSTRHTRALARLRELLDDGREEER